MNYARLLLSPFVLSVAWFFVVIAITKLFARGPTLLSGVIALIFGAPVIVPAVKVAPKRSNISYLSSMSAITSLTICMT